jgi:Flp pilus assembly protein TadG
MTLMTMLLPFLVIPLVGLAIDGTKLYIVQSKLSAAVDGAALGAGRLLGTTANTKEIAAEFLKANFPAGYWSTDTLQYNIQYDPGTTPGPNLGVQTISIYATVNLPTTFMRVAGITTSLVSASNIATRRVTRLIMVLDRSGSMKHTDPVTGQDVFATMQAGAKWFAAQFTPGYDEIGLVVFSSSGIVAYPTTRPWDPSPTGAGGPDKTFATNPQTQTGVIFDQLNAMAVGGGTATPEALALAWIEMQKTHTRDLAALGVDNTLNTIVLFTDGVPDSIATYANDPSHNALKPFGANTDDTHSHCTNNPATGVASTQMRGSIIAGSQPFGPGAGDVGWQWSIGAIRLLAYDNSSSLTTWLGNTGANDLSNPNPNTAFTGCKYWGKAVDGIHDLMDLAKIPDFDMYGSSTGGNAYSNSVLYDGTNTWHPNSTSYNAATPATLNPTRPPWDGIGNTSALPYQIAAAAWNATDAIGKTIRTQNIMNPVQIFTIGYSGNGGTDTGLLNRLANTPQSTSFVPSPTEPVGKFYLVNSTAGLQAAFSQVASSILRLAQ